MRAGAAGFGLILAAGLGLAACQPVGPTVLASASASGSSAMTGAGTAPEPAARPAPPARSPQRVLISGHSLLGQPLGIQLAALSVGSTTPIDWQAQVKTGSLIRERTRGPDPTATGWTGYLAGDNRAGTGLDIGAELRTPRAAGQGWDVLLVTERNDILWALFHEDTARYLRHAHERLIQGNPVGQTVVYEAWQSLAPDQVADWIAYERQAGVAWRCVASRVNTSLAHEGRADRIESLPAGQALAWLVEQALSPTGVPGVSGASAAQTLSRLFTDDVHLTDLGTYYMAAVSWAFLHRAEPPDAPPPAGVDAATAAALRNAAWQAYRALTPQAVADLSPPACRQALQTLCPVYWAYIETRMRAHGNGYVQSKVQAWRNQRTCVERLGFDDARNPTWFDPASDRSHWFADR